jgi:hypothetical protein
MPAGISSAKILAGPEVSHSVPSFTAAWIADSMTSSAACGIVTGSSYPSLGRCTTCPPAKYLCIPLSISSEVCQSPGSTRGASNLGDSAVSVAVSGRITSRLGSFKAISSGISRQKVFTERSARVRRSTNIPSTHPPTRVSRIALRLSILGKCGNCANAPTRSLMRRDVSPACHRLYGPSGSSASALIVVS